MKSMKGNRFWLALSLGLMFLAGIVAALVQTSAGKIAVKDMRWETGSGEMLSALLFKPGSATIDHPAPAIVVSHGWWNNREIQSPICVELARRGYVVVAVDMYGHGNSDNLRLANAADAGTGIYDAVRLVAEFPYVDKAKIGILGHSHGARSCNYCVAIDQKEPKPLIAAVMLVDSEPIYFNAQGKYADVYGSRHVGLVADRYDEFRFRTYGACDEVLTTPREYIGTANAQSFLHFGVEPERLTDRRLPGKFYTDGRAIRVVFTPDEIHPWSLISKTTVGSQLAFFEKVFGAPNTIPVDSQIWQIKHLFTTIGLVGFGMFLVAFAKVLARHFNVSTNYVIEQRTYPYGQEFTLHGKRVAWFWIAMLLCAIVAGVTYRFIGDVEWISGVTFNYVSTIFTQGKVFFIAFWLAVNGVVSLIIVAVSCLLFCGKNVANLRDSGVLPGWRRFFSAIGVGSIVVAAAFGVVFVINYLFKTDLRFWLVGVKAFTPDKLCLAVRYLPLMAVYFFANSIVINCFNPARRAWLNGAALLLMNILGPAALLAAQYVTVFRTGDTIRGFDGIFGVWLIPILIYFAGSTFISRSLYRATRNPYLGGFINAAAVTMVAVTNALTVVR